tara:strand:+ start:41 stop:301 length:261 start_codon:yes stop_codon:yes gene_type:complete
MPTFKENKGGMKPSGYKMKYSNSAFPFKSGLGSTAAQPFDVDDLSDLKKQNKQKIAELKADMNAGKISKEAFTEAVSEIKAYVNPE